MVDEGMKDSNSGTEGALGRPERLPVEAWEKLKGHGPFPQTVPDDKLKMEMEALNDALA